MNRLAEAGLLDSALRLAVLGMYAMSAAVFLRNLFADQRDTVFRGPHRWALTGVVCHGVVLLLLWMRLKRPPLGTLAEALLVCAFFTACALVLVDRLARVRARGVGAFMMPIAVCLYILGLLGPTTETPHGTDFDNPWFRVHVGAFFVAYAAFAVSFCTGVMYLLLAREIRTKRLDRFFRRLPSLDDLDAVSSRAVWFGLPLVAVGMLSGIVWTASSHRQWWVWEPKAVAALFTVLLYVSYVIARLLRGWSGRRAAVLAIVGFALSVFTLVGGSLLSQHGRGF